MEVRLEDLFCKGLEIYTQGLLDRGNRSHTLDPSAFLRLGMALCFNTYPVDQLYRVNRLIESHKSHCLVSAHGVPQGLPDLQGYPSCAKIVNAPQGISSCVASNGCFLSLLGCKPASSLWIWASMSPSSSSSSSSPGSLPDASTLYQNG